MEVLEPSRARVMQCNLERAQAGWADGSRLPAPGPWTAGLARH